jgi:hypothetical protein
MLQTKTGAEMQAEANAKHLARRAALVRELAAHDTRSTKDRAPLAARRSTAADEVATAERALAAAKTKLRIATAALSQADQTADWHKAQLTRELAHSAGEPLAAFLERVSVETDRLRNWRLIDERRELVTTGYSVAHGVLQQAVAVDNREQITARLEALADAAAEAQRLASTTADFAAALETIWAALPSENMT